MANLLLLDTNIVSNFIRFPGGPAAMHFRNNVDARLGTSVVVLAELYFGSERVGSPKLRLRIETAIALIDVLPLEEPFAEHYAQIRSHLERHGTPISGNDLFIAAHARSLGATLVTDNIREFSRVPDLRVENWLD
jgi:tRNA(fMet)-specific endonuclease VapC